MLEESPALKQSMLRRSGPGRSQEEEIDDSPDVPPVLSRSGTPLLREPNPETQIRQSWLKREYRSEKNGEKIGHFLGRKRWSVGQWGCGEMVPRGDQEGDGAYGGV